MYTLIIDANKFNLIPLYYVYQRFQFTVIFLKFLQQYIHIGDRKVTVEMLKRRDEQT